MREDSWAVFTVGSMDVTVTHALAVPEDSRVTGSFQLQR